MSLSPRDTLWALPNLLTYLRLLAIPLVVLCLFWPNETTARWVAFGIYAGAAITDYFDGWLARRFHLDSALGRMLDPIADKLLIAACLLMLVADKTISGFSLWAAIVILCREILVSGLREFLSGLQLSVPVSNVAKWKTTAQLVAVGMLLAAPAVHPSIVVLGIILLWIAALLTLYTGWDYIRSGMKHLV
jgi:cardiolipin synthase (CMP-forming)